MRPGNPDRNQKIFTLWKSGLTIDEISAQLNTPRSTVGYYVRKFNRYASKGKPFDIPRDTQNRQEVIASVSAKLLTGTAIVEIFNSGQAQELYYRLAALKLAKEFGIYPTGEDVKALQEALKPQRLNEIIPDHTREQL
jgi:hypothetical protein